MALLEKYLVVKKSTIPGAGNGLFTTVDIPKETRIVEYKGRRTTWKEVKNDTKNAYIYTINNNNVIDAEKTLSALARYANDARGFTRIKGVTNNCVYVNEGGRAFIESVKNIPAGSEIFVDYTQDYWKTMKQNLKDQGLWKKPSKKATKTASTKQKTATKKKATSRKKA
ncbi:MAG: SET domain-containing protein-lysine N-methyltransferase [Chitinophagaceae bacterium]